MQIFNITGFFFEMQNSPKHGTINHALNFSVNGTSLAPGWIMLQTSMKQMTDSAILHQGCFKRQYYREEFKAGFSLAEAKLL